MNTTRTTLEQHDESYSVVRSATGDQCRHARWPIAALVLHRSGQLYRNDLIHELLQYGVAEIFYIVDTDSSPVENRNHDVPGLHRIVTMQELEPAKKIRIAIRETRYPWLLVLHDDMQILPVRELFMEQLVSSKALCVVPQVRNHEGVVIPSQILPISDGPHLRFANITPSQTEKHTLFPFDYQGFYHRDRFISCMGYDPAFLSSFWQKADFGFRARLWGLSIVCHPEHRLQYRADIPIEDQTITEDYVKFYTYNILPRFLADHAVLPSQRFFRYAGLTTLGFRQALRDFRQAQAWVYKHRYRFTDDARSLTDFWFSSETTQQVVES